MDRLISIIILFLLAQSSIGQAILIRKNPQTGPAPQRSLPKKNAANYAARIRAFESYLKRRMAIDHVPAVGVGFVFGDFTWTNGFGLADLENNIPATSKASYRLASVTKPMTAVAVMQLAEKGKIDLDAEVQKYVPYFPKKKWSPTVRQLLGHLGGIDAYRSASEERIKEQKTMRESIAIFENFDLVFEPGTHFFYTSYGYNLLGAVIESASGMDWETYMKENVWAPAKMSHTRADSTSDLIQNRVTGYRLLDGELKKSEFVDVSSRLSAGGIRTTIEDMLSFGKAVIDKHLLSESSYELMFNSMATRDGRFTDYGMGWRVAPQNGQFVVTHNGAQPETSTTLYLYPAKRLVIALASNLEGAHVDSYAQRLFEILTDEDYGTTFYDAERGDESPFSIAFRDIFESGRAYFYRFNRPITSDQKELSGAFAYLNGTLDEVRPLSPQEALDLAKRGRHPVADRAFVKVGSFVAWKLQEKYGKGGLESYSRRGALAFLLDYIQLYKSDPTIPTELRFKPSLERTIEVWHKSWLGTYAHEKVGFETENPRTLATGLKEKFAGQAVYPDYSGELINLMRQLLVSGRSDKALMIADLIETVYPRLENPSNFQGIYGAALIISGKRERGKSLMELSLRRNGNGSASPSRLNALAQTIANTTSVVDAISLLQVATELHQNVAGLYYSLGELYLRAGILSKASDSYRKALEINPSFPKADRAREALRRLTQKLDQ